jgi:hypothetical protein
MLRPFCGYCLNNGSCGAQFSPFWRIAQRSQIKGSTVCFKTSFNQEKAGEKRPIPQCFQRVSEALNHCL